MTEPTDETHDAETGDAETASGTVIEDMGRQAVLDAQYLVAHAAKSGLDVDREILETLIEARNNLPQGRWTTAAEVEFWEAFKNITREVKPVTVESVKSLYPPPKGTRVRLLSRLFGATKARRMVNVITFLTLVVLAFLLAFQIYWVVGNALTTNIANLLQQETELTEAINREKKAYSVIELQFKMNESNSQGTQSDEDYAFYYTPEWQRETLETTTERERLEAELEALRRRLNRNASILLVWSAPFTLFTRPDDTEAEEFEQIAIQRDDLDDRITALQEKMAADPDGEEEISAKRAQLDDLRAQLDALGAENEGSEQAITQQAQLIEQMRTVETWLNTPDRAQQIISQRQLNLADLRSQKASLESQLNRELTKEESRRALVTADFVLVILQSYFLPLLYGLLGACAFILRSLAREIKTVTYSKESDISYALRLALGALAGLIVGWFVFLLPGETVLSSVSPLAIAFLVGYNIEILFSLMDKLIVNLSKPPEEEQVEPA